jgi:PAS domain S-box-containing protein
MQAAAGDARSDRAADPRSLTDSTEALRRLLDVSAALVEAETPGEIVQVLLSEGRAALGADSALVFLLDETGTAIELAGSIGHDPSDIEPLRRVPMGFPMPTAEVIRTGQPAWLSSQEDVLAGAPGIERPLRAIGAETIAAVPLLAPGGTLGAVSLQFVRPRVFDDLEKELALGIARQCAVALERARLRGAERRSAHQLETLANSGVIGVIVETEDRIEQANDALLEMIGRTRDDLNRGRLSWRSITADGWHHADARAMEELLSRGVCHPYEKELIRGDGSLVPVQVGAALLDAQPFRAVAYILDMTELVALERDRDRLLHDERVAREEAERTREQLAFLAGASEMLFSSLDPRETLAQVVRAAVPWLADLCMVELLDGQELNLLAVEHVDPDKVRLAQRFRERMPPDPASPAGAWEAIRSGKSALMTEVTDEILERIEGTNPEGARLIRELHLTSAMTVPLFSGGVAAGAITFIWAESERHYSEDDLALAEDLARRAGMALEQARLYEERRRVADTLQRSLMPPAFPDVPGLDVSSRYRPAGDATQVGGDFYDLFPTDDGAWGLALGDVSGKGAQAAAIMGIARYTIRTAALSDQRPSSILKTLNEALLRQTEDQRFCTVVYARVRMNATGARLTLACGGHPPPLIVRSDGIVESTEVTGVLIGAFPDVEIEDRPLDLGPGDALVLYSDGVVEERRGEEQFGQRRLGTLLAGTPGLPAREIVDLVISAVEGFSLDAPHDDIAVVVVRVQGAGEPETRRSHGLVRSGTRAAAEARRLLDTLAPDLDAGMLADARLLVSELVTNAVRHADMPEDSTIEVRAVAEPQRMVRVEVHDEGTGFDPGELPPLIADDPREAGWGLVLVDRLSSRWGVERGAGFTVWFEVSIEER